MQQSLPTSIFGTPAWLESMRHAYETPGRTFFEMHIHGVSGQIAVPLVEEAYEIPEVGKIRIARFAGAFASDYLDFIGIEHVESDCLDQLSGLLRAAGIDALWLANIIENSPLGRAVQEITALDPSSRLLPCIPTLRIRAESSYEKYLSTRSHNTRDKAKKRARRLAQMDAQFELLPASDTLIEELLELQRSRARIAALLPIVDNPPLLNLLRSALKSPEGAVARLRIREETVAALGLFHVEGSLSIYTQGFQPESASLSPSTSLIERLIQEVHHRRLGFVDFLRGDEPYKRHYANEEVRMVKFVRSLCDEVNVESLAAFVVQYEE